MLLFVSCSSDDETNESSTKEGETASIERISEINGKVFETTAGEDLLIELGPIKTSSGRIVNENDNFEIKVKSGGIDLGQRNSGLLVQQMKSNSKGIVSFSVAPPTKKGVYKLTVQGVSYESAVGVVYVQVNPAEPSSIGKIVSPFFRDLPNENSQKNYNGVKETSEKYALKEDGETVLIVGPIVDKYGNLIDEGKRFLVI